MTASPSLIFDPYFLLFQITPQDVFDRFGGYDPNELVFDPAAGCEPEGEHLIYPSLRTCTVDLEAENEDFQREHEDILWVFRRSDSRWPNKSREKEEQRGKKQNKARKSTGKDYSQDANQEARVFFYIWTARDAGCKGRDMQTPCVHSTQLHAHFLISS